MPGASIQSGNAVPIAQKIVIHIEKDNGVFIPLVVDIPHTITSIEQFMSLQMVAKDVYRQQVSKLVRLGRLLNLEHPSIRIARLPHDGTIPANPLLSLPYGPGVSLLEAALRHRKFSASFSPAEMTELYRQLVFIPGFTVPEAMLVITSVPDPTAQRIVTTAGHVAKFTYAAASFAVMVLTLVPIG